MGNDLIGDLARIAANAGGIEVHGPVKAPRFLLRWALEALALGWVLQPADGDRRIRWVRPHDARPGCRCRWLGFLLCKCDFRLD